MAEPLFGNTFTLLIAGILVLLVLFVLLQIFYRYLFILMKKIKAMMLGHAPKVTLDVAKKYSHAHDAAYVKTRALEDKLLPKYGAKKTERMLTHLINKNKNKNQKNR